MIIDKCITGAKCIATEWHGDFITVHFDDETHACILVDAATARILADALRAALKDSP